MRLRQTILQTVVVLIFAGIAAAAAADISNNDLHKSCTNKTLVYNKKGVRIGEKLDGFCAGYLQATLDALKNTAGSKCNTTDEKTPDYLLSIYETYTKEKNISPSESASKTLLDAYRRAFNCK